MSTLYKTEPHSSAVLCRTHTSSPEELNLDLSCYKYQCNGALAGIAICGRDSPTRCCTLNSRRSSILAAKAVAKAKNDKSAAGAVMDVIKLDKEVPFWSHQGLQGWYLVSWRRSVKTRLDRFCLAQAGARGKGFVCSSRSSGSEALPLLLPEPSVTTLVRPGCGGRSGWLSSLTLKCTQFGNTRPNMKIRLLAEAN